jgi:AAHS family 4-hydroxybenzoate transporter-like MFS transporter
MKTVDVGAVLDDGHFGGYQKLLVFATALTIILDGFDNQVMGGAIPVLMREWSLPRSAFAYVLTAGMIGMMVGGAIGGVLGDKFGRRVALLGSVLTFGVLTIAVSFANSIPMLIALRFLAGLGLGGAMPSATAISSEYVPRRKRPVAVTLTVICIPLGGAFAGWIGGYILPRYGWRVLFAVGGAIPLVLAALLFKVLPESPRYMARVRERWGELRTLMRRLGHDVPDDATFVDSHEAATKRASVAELFVPEYRADTIALFACFLFCFFGAYLGTNWVPSMLSSAKFGDGPASYGLLAWNLGVLVFALLAAFVMSRIGSRITMLVLAAGGVAGCVTLAMMNISPAQALPVFIMLGVTGGLVNATQTTMYALAANVYPTSIRGTGVGTTVAVGRIGGVLSPILGAIALTGGTIFGTVRIGGGASTYFLLIAGTISVAFVALASVKRHVPKPVAGAKAVIAHSSAH